MDHHSRLRRAAGLVGWLAVSFLAAAVGSVGSSNAASFYQQLERPGWAPPAWLFGPVWTVLYALMGVAAWLVWRRRVEVAVRRPLVLFVAQLGVNALWSWIFFRWQWPAAAFVEILALWGLIVATMMAFRRVDRVAMALLVPYLAWVTFAAALTFAIWRSNPQV